MTRDEMLLTVRTGRFHLDMLEGEEDIYSGHTFGQRWNGWATPMFSRAEADRFMERYQSAIFSFRGRELHHPARYNEADDTYEFYMEPIPVGSEPTWSEEEIDRYQGHQIPGVGQVYSIGAFSWTWTEVLEESL